ncbi:MAG: hypothetical protein U5L02_01710 [Rheinheimera sp.]|nr:hypothetical protein [Rheinheimera sp.]
MQTLWLYLLFPQLQLDLSSNDISPEQAATPEPAVLLHPQDLRVHQANAPARSLGIKPGQTLAQACALCAALQVMPWQPALEQQLLDMLALDCYQLCADIAEAPPNALWLRLDPMLQLYGGLPAFLQQLKQQLQQRPLQYQYGVALSAEAARLLCLSQPGQTALTQAQQQLRLTGCPVSFLQVTPATIQQLERLGISQLGQLLLLPATELSRRFGADLYLYLQRLQGKLPPLLQYYQPPEQFSARLELLYQLEQYPQLHKPLQHLLLQLQHYLQRRDQLCYQLQLELTLRDQPPLTLKLQSPQAEALACRWLNLWQLKLEALRLPAPVLALSLSASQYCGRDTDSDDLYAGRRGQYTPLQLVGLLQAKLGSAQVCRPAQVAAYLPEMAGISMPLQSTAPAGVKPPPRPQPAQVPAQTVAQTAAQTVAQSVAQTAATYHTGPAPSTIGTFTGLPAPHRPAFLLAQPEPLQQQVQLQPGLERIQSQWWQGPSEARDYLTAQSVDGRWLWIYRTAQQQWFVHGVFA